MRKCQRCQATRIISINAKCDDRCFTDIHGIEKVNYPPSDIGVGGGDYVEMSYCLQCGQLQGTFPLPLCEMEQQAIDEAAERVTSGEEDEED